MKINTWRVPFVGIFLLCCAGVLPAKSQTTIIRDGKSKFSIVIPENAPPTLREAAQELQKDLQLSTGALLPISKESDAVKPPFISVGNTAQAQEASLNVASMKDESYRIVTKAGNLYILGPDTPDGGSTKAGGTSNGSASGIYVFLETFLGVRWLMPGKLGLDVPRESTFTVNDIDRTETPVFNFRLITDSIVYYSNDEQLQNVQNWLHHMRIGTSSSARGAFRGSKRLDYDHNWWRTVNGINSFQVDTPAVRELYQKHPEWFAMDASGNRPYPSSHYAKLETTNPELVQWFAGKAVQAIKSSPTPRMYSLSPSDGRAWSQSPESKALYDPVPQAGTDPEAPAGNPSMSSLVLKWYHDVAQIVEKECPDCKLGGYIYADYIFSPQKYQMKLPENFTPVLAASFNYGFGLYRPEVQKRFRDTMQSWAKVAPADWYYYDLPNVLMRQYEGDIGSLSPPVNLPGNSGLVVPSAPDILNTIFPVLLQNHIKGVNLYSADSWSSGAMTNYVVAKMMWDPRLKAEVVERDWLHRAYGAAAGTKMEQFYSNLNAWFRDYYRQGKGQSYNLSVDMLREVYAAHYPEMETILLQAKAQSMTATQKQRLQLIEDNLIVLQWRLRNSNLLDEKFTSPLTRTNQQIIELLATPNSNFVTFPGVMETDVAPWVKAQSFPWKVSSSQSAQVTDSQDAIPAELKNVTVLYAIRDGEIRILPKLVKHGAYFASYNIKDEFGVKISTGILSDGIPISLPAKSGSAYYLTVIPRKSVSYILEIADAALASARYDNKAKSLELFGESSFVQVAHIEGSEPIGAEEINGKVVIRKPYIGANYVASLRRGGEYSQTRVLASLGDDWRFRTDPQNNLSGMGADKLDYDDRHWRKIDTTNVWQAQGFPDYHGVAWYRRKFMLPPLQVGEAVQIYFDSVDGNATVYLNGQKLRDHILGPAPAYTGWDKPFVSEIPVSFLAAGENVLSVQVTSKSKDTASGMTGGCVIIGKIRAN